MLVARSRAPRPERNERSTRSRGPVGGIVSPADNREPGPQVLPTVCVGLEISQGASRLCVWHQWENREHHEEVVDYSGDGVDLIAPAVEKKTPIGCYHLFAFDVVGSLYFLL